MVDLFRTTRWSLIVAAGRNDERADAALAELCEAYWRPVYVFIRRKGYSTDDAADLTQGFFLHLLEHHAFGRADQSRGRFRSYLLTAVRNFVETARLRDLTLRRGARAQHDAIETIDVDRRPSLSADDRASSPERVFERHWALNLTERAVDSVRAEYVSRGQEHVFNELRPFLTSEAAPSSPDGSDSTPADAAHRTALHRARRRLGRALRAEIRETVNDGREVDEELRFLLRVLAG